MEDCIIIERYIVIKGSWSAHCCFEYSVIDTKEGKEDFADHWKKQVCETFEEEDANKICSALNFMEKEITISIIK